MITIDLQQYFPDNGVYEYRKADGSLKAKYTLQKSPTPVDSLYNTHMNLNKPGTPYMWRKEYWQSGAWCTATYGVLFFGTDGSITETGDWMVSTTACTPNTVLGYRTDTGANTGLLWSPPGGLSCTPSIIEVNVVRQNTPGAAITDNGSDAYSKVGLIKHYATYTPPYGRDANGVWTEGAGKTYTDVVHMVMYHGTRKAIPAPVRCVGPISASGAYYQSYKDYNTYAIELYLAKGIGIIQENTPFIEDATFWGMQNCTGDIFQYPGQWATYIDQ